MEAQQLEAQIASQKTRIDQISENLYRCDVCAVRDGVVADLPEEAVPENCDGYGVLMKFRMFYGENCLTVPASAVFSSETQNRSQDCVFAVRSGRAVRVPVDVVYQAGDIAVLSAETSSGGISAGDTVVADADTEDLSDGVRVKIRKKKQKE